MEWVAGRSRVVRRTYWGEGSSDWVDIAGRQVVGERVRGARVRSPDGSWVVIGRSRGGGIGVAAVGEEPLLVGIGIVVVGGVGAAGIAVGVVAVGPEEVETAVGAGPAAEVLRPGGSRCTQVGHNEVSWAGMLVRAACAENYAVSDDAGVSQCSGMKGCLLTRAPSYRAASFAGAPHPYHSRIQSARGALNPRSDDSPQKSQRSCPDFQPFRPSRYRNDALYQGRPRYPSKSGRPF